jgi:DNA-directed RNA polymerase subunit H (RpoH/RPB5)
MSRLVELKKHLRVGQVYRRCELAEWSNAVDRHLDELLQEGVLEKLSQGLYYVPKTSAFGKVPPEEDVLVQSFLKDDRFLLLTPNFYNSLGVGTTQLYNKKIVYNHKRHGKFILGNREFEFQLKHHFPKKVSEEFLLVDLANNLDNLAEDRSEILRKLLVKASQLPQRKLKRAVAEYGNIKTKKLFKSVKSETLHV